MNGNSDRAESSPEQEKLKRLTHCVLNFVKDLRSQNQALIERVGNLQEFIRIQQEKWEYDVRFLEDIILELNESSKMKDKELCVIDRKCALLTGLMHREISISKLKSDCAESELEDLKSLLDILHGPQSQSGESEGELASSISALSQEDSFVWWQYLLLENNLSENLRTKEMELEQSNEKVKKLIADMEMLQSINRDKDELIAILNSSIEETKADARRWKDEAFMLSKELNQSRSSTTAQSTPVVRSANGREEKSQRQSGSKRDSKRKAADADMSFQQEQPSKRVVEDQNH